MLEGGGINPLQLTYGLAAAASRHGAQLYAHSPMQQWRKQAGWHELITPNGTVRARQVVLVSNGYRDSEEPGALRNRVLPAISNILVTRPLSAAQWQAIGLHSLAPMSDTGACWSVTTDAWPMAACCSVRAATPGATHARTARCAPRWSN